MCLISKLSCDRSSEKRISKRGKISTRSFSMLPKRKWKWNANRKRNWLKKLKSRKSSEIRCSKKPSRSKLRSSRGASKRKGSASPSSPLT